VKEEWETKDEKLRPYQDYLSKLASEFDEIKFAYISKDKNKFTNVLATLTSMTHINIGGKIQPIKIKVGYFHTHCCSLKKPADGKPWYNNIKKFMQYQEYPPGAPKTNEKNFENDGYGLLLEWWNLVQEVIWRDSAHTNGYIMRKRQSKHCKKSTGEFMPLMLVDIYWQDKYNDLDTSCWLWKGIVLTMSGNVISIRFMVTR